MSTLAASNLDEPPPKINHPPLQSPSSFSSLSNDIVLDILARVPKRYYPILSCVSKNLQIIVRSREIQKTRSLLGKDSLYICFRKSYATHDNWFTPNLTENLLVPIEFPFPRFPDYYSITAVGQEIFCIGGISSLLSSSFRIFDSRFGNFRKGPNMQVELKYTSTVGLVGGKIYVIGLDKHNKINVEFFDLKTQTWNPAPIPPTQTWSSLICPANNFALDRKICVLKSGFISFYDTRDGSCESIELANNLWCYEGVCVIDNVLYVYYKKLGLMWYDSRLKQWRMVNGLNHLNKYRGVALAEYYGKLAYIEWVYVVGSETKQIWCRMIALDKSEDGVHGTAEPSRLLGTVPRDYKLQKCLSSG